MNFYSLYSKSLGRYNRPFLAHDDGDAIEQVSKMVSMQNDGALLASLDDLRLEHVGRFVSEGVEYPVNNSKVRIVIDDLHKNLPLPPMIKARLDKFYAGGNPDAE